MGSGVQKFMFRGETVVIAEHMAAKDKLSEHPTPTHGARGRPTDGRVAESREVFANPPSPARREQLN